MSRRALAAEFIGTFMLMAAVLASTFYAFEAPSGEAGIIGVALSVGFTVMALAFAIGHISGGHFNPAVTLGLVAGGRVGMTSAPGYIAAQCLGAIAAAAMFGLIGRPSASFAANGYDGLSMLKTGMLAVFLLEALLTAFFVIVVMGATSRGMPPGFAPIAMGVALVAIYVIAFPVSGASTNPARSLGAAVYGGMAAIGQLWLFWVAPILGGVLGGAVARWLLEE